MKRLKAKKSQEPQFLYTYYGEDAFETQVFSYLEWKIVDRFQTEQEAMEKAEIISGTWGKIRVVKPDGSIIKVQ